MTTFCKKSQKPYFEAILSLSAQIWAKIKLSEEKESVSFKIFQLSTIVQKIRKKNNDPLLRKMPNRQTVKKTDNSDFIGPSVRQGSKNLIYFRQKC